MQINAVAGELLALGGNLADMPTQTGIPIFLGRRLLRLRQTQPIPGGIMRVSIYPTANRALNELLRLHGNEPLRVADVLGINDAHIYIFRKHGRITPKLRQCLIDYDYVPPPVKRHRVALEVDTPAEAAALRALLARHGSRRRIARALVRGELKIVTKGE